MEYQNKNPYIFIICGKPKSGKDTVAVLIQKYYAEKNKKVMNLQYSSYIKRYAKKIVGWDGQEETKPREFLNTVGMELIHDTIDSNFTIRRTLEDMQVYAYFYDVLTVSDARFVKEIEEPKKLFSHVFSIHITSPVGESALDSKAIQHRTNHGLDDYHTYDYEIVNDKGIEELKEKVYTILKEVEKNEH